MATRVYKQRFRESGDEFIAKGPDQQKMPVFRVTDRSEVRTKMTFPACLRFMPYAELIGGLVTEDAA